MSLVEIEAELDKLTSDELRRLAMKSWAAFVEKEAHLPEANQCDEDDPGLLEALDKAVAEADATPGQGHSAEDVLARLRGWTSR